MRFAIYAATGRIVQTGECLDSATSEDFSHFTDAVLLGITPDVSIETHYIDDGAAVPTPVRPSDAHVFNYTTKLWELDFDAVRSQKSVDIDQACRSTILAGFDSDALGTTYHYPAKATDQSNLSGSVLASLLPDTPAEWVTPFWCADGDGVWAFRLHTAAQIQQVGRDAKAAILVSMGKNELLQTQIASATSLEELNTITW